VGGVQNLTVAVSVDGTYEVPEGGDAPVYQPLQQDELDRIQRMVQTAVGLNVGRGDRIEVVNLQFQGDRIMDAPGGANPIITMVLDLVSRHGGRGLLLILLGSMVLVFRRNLSGLLTDLSSTMQPGSAAAAAAGGAGGQGGPAQAEGERFEGMPALTDQMIEDVREYAAENPERVAEVVQSWLYEPERNR